MADITMCENWNCPSNKNCYRYQAEPHPFWQYYMKFEPIEGEVRCLDYISCGGEGIVMQFRISKTNNGSSTQWAIIPTSGKFEDKVVAVADAVNMSNAHFVAKTCIGTIKSVWGLEIKDPEIHHDRETLRGLSLGKAIDAYPTEVLTLDYDGYWDVAKRKCSRARRLLCFCDAIYAKGAE